MPQYVKEWMSHTIITIEPDCLLQEAINLLCLHNVQYLFFVDTNKKQYAISSLQIRTLANDQNSMRVFDLMTPLTTFAKPDWALQKALFVMQKLNTSFLPVKNEHNDLIGVISIEAFYVAAQEIKWRIDSPSD